MKCRLTATGTARDKACQCGCPSIFFSVFRYR
jgi:hypothetical protein